MATKNMAAITSRCRGCLRRRHFSVIAKTASARTYVAIVGLLVLGALFAALGAWQLGRAETSRATRAQFDARRGRRPCSRRCRARSTTPTRFRRLEVGGEYIGRAAVPARQHAARRRRRLSRGDGAAHAGRRERVLVNRGWVPAGGDRRVLPDVERRRGVAGVVSGRLERLPRPGLRLGAEGDTGAPVADVVVLQYPTAHGLAARLGEPVLDYQLLLDAGSRDGFVREWRAPGVAPERHLAYAGQWLALAVGAAGAAVVMTFRTVRRKP